MQHLDYSDDEQERAAKSRRKGRKAGAPTGEGDTPGEATNRRKRNRSGHNINQGRDYS